MFIPPEQNSQLQRAENRNITGDRVKISKLTSYSFSAPMVKHHVPYTIKTIWKGIVAYKF
jgi:hypothetical protein